jgi:hypothetical protein
MNKAVKTLFILATLRHPGLPLQSLRLTQSRAWQGEAARRIRSVIRAARGQSERGREPTFGPTDPRRRQAISLFSRRAIKHPCHQTARAWERRASETVL